MKKVNAHLPSSNGKERYAECVLCNGRADNAEHAFFLVKGGIVSVNNFMQTQGAFSRQRCQRVGEKRWQVESCCALHSGSSY